MAHFYGTLQGNRGCASRLGTKNSGLSSTARGWNIGGLADMFYNKEKDRDEVTIRINGGSHNTGTLLSINAHKDKDNNLVIDNCNITGYKLVKEK